MDIFIDLLFLQNITRKCGIVPISALKMRKAKYLYNNCYVWIIITVIFKWRNVSLLLILSRDRDGMIVHVAAGERCPIRRGAASLGVPCAIYLCSFCHLAFCDPRSFSFGSYVFLNPLLMGVDCSIANSSIEQPFDILNCSSLLPRSQTPRGMWCKWPHEIFIVTLIFFFLLSYINYNYFLLVTFF